MFVFNRDFRYVRIYIYIYIYIYIWLYVKLYVHAQLFITGNEKLRGTVVRNVGGVKFQPIVTT